MFKAKDVVARLALWGKKVSFIAGLYQISSSTSGLAGPGVELDFLLVMDAGHDANSILDAMRILFSEDLVIALLVPSSNACNKISLHLKGLPRINMYIANPAEEIVSEFLQAQGTTVLVERSKHDSLVEAARTMDKRRSKDSPSAGFIKRRVSSILHKFELAAVAHHQSDYLGFYALHYPLLVETIHLQGILGGNVVVNGSMKHLLNAVMNEPEQQYFTKHLLDTSFSDANEIRQYFMDWFFSLVEDVQAKYGVAALPASSDEISRFCEHVHDTYYLRNFRMVQGTSKIFRSLAPAAYKNDPRLEKWFVENDIKTLIDLRRPDEIEKSPDDPELARKLGQTICLLNFNADEVAASDYTRGLIGCKNEVRQMFEAMLNSPGSTLIHCGAGKDRTGMIAALVELLLGIPEDTIVAAYLLSGQDTREERIVQTLAYIRDHGGVRSYLDSCGFSNADQDQLIKKLAG